MPETEPPLNISFRFSWAFYPHARPHGDVFDRDAIDLADPEVARAHALMTIEDLLADSVRLETGDVQMTG